MAIVFIEEVGGSVRICSKQATADALGIASADVDLIDLLHPTEHYTLVDGSLVELTEDITAAAVVVEQEWVNTQLAESDNAIRKHNDGHTRVVGTKAAWRVYRNALRDRVQDGVIIGTRPVAPNGG
jgi:hypothetical protein